MLREFREHDLDDFHRMLSDPEVMAFAPTLPHDTIGQTREWLARRLTIAPGAGEDFVIEHSGRVIGKAGFPAFPEIGFLIARDHWGKGLAAEAVEAVVDRAFTVHRLDRVLAKVDPENAASLRLLTQIGFIETGRQQRALLVGNEWRDDVRLELSLAEWRGRPGPDAA
ncbi:MAG TPA: GNAT family N-acetyltransferase [Sphingomicrobium sp.]